MPVTPTYPGVYIEEIPSGVRTIVGVATSIAVFVGWTAKGPVDRAGRISSWQDFERCCGGLDRQSYLGYAVRHFFLNGGSDAYVMRLAANDATQAEYTSTRKRLESSVRCSSRIPYLLPHAPGSFALNRKTSSSVVYSA